MELAELNQEERLALAGLMEFVVLASGHVTEDEQQEIDAITVALGEEAYRTAVDEVDRRFTDENALKDFLKTITRQEARELIYGVVLQSAMVDTVEGRPSDLLEWLAKTWKVEVIFETTPVNDEVKTPD
jgi:hypothetical protein